MTQLNVHTVADLLDVSGDTVRRMIERGELTGARDGRGRLTVDGAELAAYVKANMTPPEDPTGVARSARNRLVGIVTNVIYGKVMTQVEIQCGRYRVVSLMTTESVHELELEPGSLAVAVVKATTVMVEKPE